MWTLARAFTLILLPGFITLVGITSVSLHMRFMRRLRRYHVSVWNSLAQPDLLWQQLSYSWWVISRGYDALGDVELDSLGDRLIAAWALVGVALALWLGCATLLGYVRWG